MLYLSSLSSRSTCSETSAQPTGPGVTREPVPAISRVNWRNVLREHRRFQFPRAALVGLGAGLLAVLFQRALDVADGYRFLLVHRLAPHPLWWPMVPLLCAAAAGMAGWLTKTFAPEAAGSGIPHVKGVLLHVRTLRWQRLLPVKFVGGVLAIGAGMSLGREGPTVQMGAAVGKAVADWMKLPRRSRGQLIAAGAGAGLAAAFNAPLAGFIFTIEELQRELSPLTYGTALIAAVIADIVTRSMLGQQPSFHVTGYPMPSLAALPLFAVVGLVAGLMGVAFNRCLLAASRFAHHLQGLPPWALPALMGAFAGLIVWGLPEATGGGHQAAEVILSGRYAPIGFLSFLALLFVVKFGLTIFSYASGVPGGIFAPLLVLGAVLGLMTGQVGSLGFPVLAQTPAAFAVVGMAAAFAAIVRAPLTGIVLILEMTNNYQQLFPLLVACMIAFLVAERLHNKPIYEALLEYDLQRSGYVHRDAHDPVLMSLAVETNSALDGALVGELDLPPDCVLALLVRNGREHVPNPDTVLQAGDRVDLLVGGDSPQTCALLQQKARGQ